MTALVVLGITEALLMVTTTFALAQKSYPSAKMTLFTPHTAQQFSTTHHRPNPTSPITFRVGMQRFGARYNRWELSEFDRQRLLSIFRQHRSCQHTTHRPSEPDFTNPFPCRLQCFGARWEPFNQQQWELSKSAVRSQPLLRPSATLLIKVLIKRYHYFFSLPTNNVTRIIIIKSTRIASRISTVTNSNESQNPHYLHQCGRRHL